MDISTRWANAPFVQELQAITFQIRRSVTKGPSVNKFSINFLIFFPARFLVIFLQLLLNLIFLCCLFTQLVFAKTEILTMGSMAFAFISFTFSELLIRSL